MISGLLMQASEEFAADVPLRHGAAFDVSLQQIQKRDAEAQQMPPSGLCSPQAGHLALCEGCTFPLWVHFIYGHKIGSC